MGQQDLRNHGAPTAIHDPERREVRVASKPVTPDAPGQKCYVFAWISEGPIILEMREMRLEREGTPTWAHVWWRPDFTLPKKPKVLIHEPMALSRKQLAALEGAIRDFLEGKPKPGPKPRPDGVPPDWAHLRWLSETVERLIQQEEGAPSPAAIQEAMAHMGKDKFRRKREALRVTTEQLDACIGRLVADYDRWKLETLRADRHRDVAGLADPEWRPKKPLSDLLAEESPELARLLRHKGG